MSWLRYQSSSQTAAQNSKVHMQLQHHPQHASTIPKTTSALTKSHMAVALPATKPAGCRVISVRPAPDMCQYTSLLVLLCLFLLVLLRLLLLLLLQPGSSCAQVSPLHFAHYV
jgi:hypothetical protein